jgi:hypothetical protein
MEQDIFAYYMRDGFTYVGKQDDKNRSSDEMFLNDFIIMPTTMIAQDVRTPEVVISEEYEKRNKGNSIILTLENKVSSSNISLGMRLKNPVDLPHCPPIC